MSRTRGKNDSKDEITGGIPSDVGGGIREDTGLGRGNGVT